MIPTDDGRARNFEELDVREAQEALAEELEDMIEEETAADDGALEHDIAEGEISDAVWSSGADG